MVRVLVIVSAMLGLSAAIAQRGQAPGPLTAEQLQEDLDVMAETLRRRHPGLSHFTPRPVFEKAVSDLRAELPRLTRDQAFVALNRIAVMAGDAHTFLEPSPNEPRLAVHLIRFGDELRVDFAQQGFQSAVGARVVAIGSIPVGQALAMAEALAAPNEHRGLREAWAADFLNRAEMLRGLDLAPASGPVTMTFAADDGNQFQLQVPLMTPAAWAGVTRHAISRPRAESFWCAALAEHRAVYCNIRLYEDLGRHSRAMLALIARARPEKVIIDLRQQTIGGDSNVARRTIVDPLRRLPNVNRRGGLYVLIGPTTFSAAMVSAVQFRRDTNAILVGQPLGEKPNSWSEVDYRVLPNSRWRLHHSTGYYEYQPGSDNMVRPHVAIATTWADVRAARDPVLDWVLAQPAGGPAR